MIRVLLKISAFLLLVVPSVVFAGALDDYYLSKFGERTNSAKVVAQTVLAAPKRADRCATSLHRSLKRDFKTLELSTQKVLAKYVLKPVLSGQEATFASPGGHFTIHYTRSGTDAPDLSDANANGVPDWIETVAGVFENVYATEVTGMGYQAPPVTKYDVYLRNLVPEGAYGFTTDDGFVANSTTSAASYIEIDRAFTDSIFGQDFTPLQDLQVTAAHEFHHAIQYGYNYYFDISFAEMTSTWMEDEVYDGVNQLYYYLPSYLSPLDAQGLPTQIRLDAPIDGASEYGRWIFNRHLAESHSPALIKDVWTRLGKTPAPADGGDIPMIPTLDAAVKGANGSLTVDFHEFAKKLYVGNWTSHVSEIDLIPFVNSQAIYTDYPVDLTDMGTMISKLSDYAFAYYSFTPALGAPTDLTLALPLSRVPVGTDVTAIKTGRDGSVTQYHFNPGTLTLVVPSFSVDAVDVGIVISKVPAAAAPVNGVCGSSSGTSTAFATAPVDHLCALGASSNVGGSGYWLWDCQGQDGGADARCTAPKTVIPGNCSGTGVGISQIQNALNMFLGTTPPAVCVDLDNNQKVSVSEVQSVINVFLGL